jgi:hypothetical protein
MPPDKKRVFFSLKQKSKKHTNSSVFFVRWRLLTVNYFFGGAIKSLYFVAIYCTGEKTFHPLLCVFNKRKKCKKTEKLRIMVLCFVCGGKQPKKEKKRNCHILFLSQTGSERISLFSLLLRS